MKVRPLNTFQRRKSQHCRERVHVVYEKQDPSTTQKGTPNPACAHHSIELSGSDKMLWSQQAVKLMILPLSGLALVNVLAIAAFEFEVSIHQSPGCDHSNLKEAPCPPTSVSYGLCLPPCNRRKLERYTRQLCTSKIKSTTLCLRSSIRALRDTLNL